MTELRFGRIVEIIREESSVKYKNDFFNYFIKELYVELGGNIDLFIPLDATASYRVRSMSKDYAGAGSVGGTKGVPEQLYTAFSIVDDESCVEKVVKCLVRIKNSTFKREGSEDVCTVNLNISNNANNIRGSLSSKKLDAFSRDNQRRIQQATQNDIELIARILTYTIKYVSNHLDNLEIPTDIYLPNGLRAICYNVLDYLGDEFVISYYDDLFSKNIKEIRDWGEPYYPFLNNFETVKFLTMKDKEITIRYEELQNDIFGERTKIILARNLLDSQVIQRAFMGSTESHIEFIMENFLSKNVYLSYGYFDGIDELIDNLLSFVFRKINENNAIDIMLEYPMGTSYSESMSNKEKIEKALTIDIGNYFTNLVSSMFPNNHKLALQKLKESPKADKSFNVLSDFRISKSTVHTSGVIVWVLLG